MLAPIVAAVAAVLVPAEIVLIDVDTLTVTSRVPLPGAGLALVAAPDGRLVVPLAGHDETLLIDPSGTSTRWPARVMPLFFDEWDRMHVAMPELIATLSYPERLPLWRRALPGVQRVAAAACSRDGRLVALAPSGSPGALLIGTSGGGEAVSVPLPGAPKVLAVAPSSGWAVVGLEGGRLALLAFGSEQASGAIELGGEVVALEHSADGRRLFAGLRTVDGGAVVTLKVDPGSKEPLREKARAHTPTAVRAVMVAGTEVVALLDGRVVRIKGSRIAAEVNLPEGSALALLPDKPRTAVPSWSEDAR